MFKSTAQSVKQLWVSMPHADCAFGFDNSNLRQSGEIYTQRKKVTR